MKKILSALMALTLLFSICSPLFSVSAKDAPARDSKKVAMSLPENLTKHLSEKNAESKPNAQPQVEYMLETGPFSSVHPYASNTYNTWKYENPDTNVTYLEITFSSTTKTEKDYDFIYIYDADKKIVGVYSGDQLAGKTIKILGNSFYLVLDTDNFANFYGFDVTAVNGIFAPTVSGNCGVNLNWTFTFNTGILAITGTGNMDDFDYDFDTKDCNTPWKLFNTSILWITFDSGVTSIGDFAFASCKGLTSVEIPAGVTDIGVGVFAACTALTEIIVADANANYVSFEGVLFSKDMKKLIQYPLGFYPGEDDYGYGSYYTIPESVTSIGDYSFAGYRLSQVYLPRNLTSIGAYSFAFCRLFTINICSKVTDIGEGAFIECVHLNSANFSGNAPAMGNYVFDGCGYGYGEYDGNGFTVYYYEGKTGFSDPWHTYHTESRTLIVEIMGNCTWVKAPGVFSRKLKPFDFYRGITSSLWYDSNVGEVSAEWKSDNKNVVIDENGNITNKGILARKANITLTVTDADGVKYSQTVKVVFYKYDWQLKYLTK